jgi:O-antigen/teichoic acid export membrane protein
VDEQQSSYRQIFKATSIFGGVQVVNILIGIVRVKFVAILLGTAGVGIMGLLNAPVQLIVSITGLGIAFSSVREISEAHGKEDQSRISRAITTLRRWSWFTGALGAVVTLTLAPQLSQWSFGNRSYTWAFVWLSVTLLFQALSKGQSAILQGTRRIRDMAKAGVLGSFAGLLISLPLYYLYDLNGIVPAMVVTALSSLILSWYFSRRIVIEKNEDSLRESFHSGISIAKLGIMMTMAGFLSTATGYILNAYISRSGGLEQVGLYNSGIGILTSYIGLIFTAMGTDYYPRLAAINQDNDKVILLVNQQIETAVLILGPLLAGLIIFMPIVIRILYSAKFIPVVIFVCWATLGIQLKAMTWAMGYILLAKNKGSLFFMTELIGNIFALACNIYGYYLFGLKGLGISVLVNYFFAYFLTYIITRWKFKMQHSMSVYITFSISFLFCLLCFLIVSFFKYPIVYLLGSILTAISFIYSLNELNKRIGLKYFLNKFVERLK